MIICASRRTDIPAFHSEWFMNRIRAGYALVRNPMCRNLVERVSLEKRDVDCIFFMSKNPVPMENNLDEIDSMGFDYTFQVTITPYGKDIEPNVPMKADVSDCCRRISERIGRGRMLWRYDPVMFNENIDLEYHRRRFDTLCREASAWTDRCVFSFLDMYRKLECSDIKQYRPASASEMDQFMRMAVKTAEEYGIDLSYCCSKTEYTHYGISSDGCFGPKHLKMLDIPYEIPQKPIRECCGCVKSIDIGQYDTCMNDCVYCYANRPVSDRSERIYNPDSEMLSGSVGPDDLVRMIGGSRISKITDY